jgi:hypothetical protein
MSGAELIMGAIALAGLFESSSCIFEFLESTSQDDKFKDIESTLTLRLRQLKRHEVQAKDCIKDLVGFKRVQRILEGCDERDRNHLLEYSDKNSAPLDPCYQNFWIFAADPTDLEGLHKFEHRTEFLIDEKASIETVYPAAQRPYSCCDSRTGADARKHAMTHEKPFRKPDSTRTNITESQISRWQIWRNQPPRKISTTRAMRLVGGILLLFPVCMVVMSNYAITSGLLEGSNSWYKSAIQVSLPLPVLRSQSPY